MHRLFRIQQGFNLHTFVSLLYDWLYALRFCHFVGPPKNPLIKTATIHLINASSLTWNIVMVNQDHQDCPGASEQDILTQQLNWRDNSENTTPGSVQKHLHFNIEWGANQAFSLRLGAADTRKQSWREKSSRRPLYSWHYGVLAAEPAATCHWTTPFPSPRISQFPLGLVYANGSPEAKKVQSYGGASTNLSCFGSDTLDLIIGFDWR